MQDLINMINNYGIMKTDSAHFVIFFSEKLLGY